MWICREEVLGRRVYIRKVTTPATGNAYFLSEFAGMIEQADMASASSCLYGTHETGRSRPDNDYITSLHQRFIADLRSKGA